MIDMDIDSEVVNYLKVKGVIRIIINQRYQRKISSEWWYWGGNNIQSN